LFSVTALAGFSGTAPLILTCAGGEITLDGVRVYIEDGHNYTSIDDGSDYLLFLKPSLRREAGRYEVYYGAIFGISQGHVNPLLKHAEDIFKSSVDARADDLVRRILTVRQR
jgi:hypothetical protein